MTLYNVHLYREMRLYFPRVEADTPEEAARIAADKLTEEAEYTEDCDGENLAALVDGAGDDQFEQSVTIDFEAERLRKAAPQMLAALTAIKVALHYYPHWNNAMPGHLVAVVNRAIAQGTTLQINQPERSQDHD